MKRSLLLILGLFSMITTTNMCASEHIALSARAKLVQRGVYQHYKGNLYRLLDVALHSETLEELVVYQALYGERVIWVRPLAMFFESVECNGKTVPRFTWREP